MTCLIVSQLVPRPVCSLMMLSPTENSTIPTTACYSKKIWMPYPTGAQLGRCLLIRTRQVLHHEFHKQKTHSHNTMHTNFVATHLAWWIPTLTLYLGITFSADMKWTKHIHNVTNSCRKVLGVMRRNFRSCSCDIKSKLNLSLVQPKLEYGSATWYPITKQDTHLLDMIQRSAARLCMNDYLRESRVTSILKDLEWQSLDTRHALTPLVLMFKISHCLVDIVWQGWAT